MLTKEHVKTAQKARNFLLEAYVEFADGDDHLQACENLWQVAHAKTAVAQHRDWEHSDLNQSRGETCIYVGWNQGCIAAGSGAD